MLTRYQASLDDRKKFTALVKDLFPDQAKNVNLLLMAYNMGIAQDIQSAYRTCTAPGNFIHNESENCISGKGMGL